MEKFRRELKQRVIAGLTFPVMAVIITVIAYNKSSSEASGFASGLIVGFSIIAAIVGINALRGLKNKDVLKKMMINETDERNIEIKRSARNMLAFIFPFAGIIISAAVMFFFDLKTGYTIAGTVVLYSLLEIVLVFYYMRKL